MRRTISPNPCRRPLGVAIAAGLAVPLVAGCAGGGAVADGPPTRTVFVEQTATAVTCDLDGDGIITVGELRACGGTGGR